MKKALFIILIICTSILSADTIKHRFYCIDNAEKNSDNLIYVDQINPKNSWIKKLPKGARHIQLLTNGRLLVNQHNGAAEYDAKSGKKLDWEISTLSGISTAIRLKNGNTLLANPQKIFEIKRDGKIVNTIILAKTPKPLMRVITHTAQDTILYSSDKPYSALEIDKTGKIVWQAKLPGKGYRNLRRGKDTIFCATGDECKVVQLDNKGKIVSFIGGKKEHPKLELNWASGFQILSNNNIIMTNWQGHNYHGNGPHIIEFDDKNRVVWSWSDKNIKSVTNLLFIDNKEISEETKTQYQRLERELRSYSPSYKAYQRLQKEALNVQSLILPNDKEPLDIIIRRTKALLSKLQTMKKNNIYEKYTKDLQELNNKSKTTTTKSMKLELFQEICELRKTIAFTNPLLDFSKIIFLKHNKMARGEKHMVDQYLGFNAAQGGGVFTLNNPFSDHPTLNNILKDSIVRTGRLAGKSLKNGSFISLDLGYDAEEIVFAWTEGDYSIFTGKDSWKNQDWSHAECFSKPKNYHQYHWRPESTYHIFKANLKTGRLEQLTDGRYNDYDPCFLPNGRIAFISERCRGNQRCGSRWGPTATLHAMMPDGSDIIQLSYHDTNEWHPSVDNNGMLIYTRWDYVDRDSDIAHHLWYCYPDGRDPRSSHGNYPKKREMRPWMELAIRAIPNSHRYIATAAPHHGQNYGSLIIIDQQIKDDRAMSQIKRITPLKPFPESEKEPGVALSRGRHHPLQEFYGTPWALSEEFYLAVYDEGQKRYGIYLVDCFGNNILLYRDNKFACLDPMPLHPRKQPAIIPPRTKQAKADRLPGDNLQSTVSIMNIYESEFPFPKGVTIKEVRIITIYPKPNYKADKPNIGRAAQSLCRGVLGTVPVEKDGSAYFEMPSNVGFYMQALDENGVAIQTMRSATYTHEGENMSCIGCHESKFEPPKNNSGLPIALKRQPSKIEPEATGSNPLLFPKLVQPVINKHCLNCHAKNPKAPSLAGNKFTRNGWSHAFMALQKHSWGKCGGNGGINSNKLSYSIPGKIGAKVSNLYKFLNAKEDYQKLPKKLQHLGKIHQKVNLSPEEFRRITLWLDCNSNFYGAYLNIKKQANGKLVIPKHGYKK